jgi:hypothetical protein
MHLQFQIGLRTLRINRHVNTCATSSMMHVPVMGRRDVELWLEVTDKPKRKQGIALVGCLLDEPKEFAKTLSTEQLIAENSGMNILNHLDKAYTESDEMILNTRVSNFLEYQRLPTISITTYIAGLYSRLDNLSQLRMPAELTGHLLLKQANLEIAERTMIVASAKGNYEIAAIVNSMKQLFGDRHDIAIAGTTYHTKNMEKRFCNYCKRKPIWKWITGKTKGSSIEQSADRQRD